MLDIYKLTINFYALQGLGVLAKPKPFLRSSEKWQRDFDELNDQFVSKFASTMYDYLALICFGELRHSSTMCVRTIENLPVNHDMGRCSAFEEAARFDPKDFLPKAEQVFANGEWSNSSYGGRKWAMIAKAAQLYGKVPDSVFLDHCVDLAHNGGLAFNKHEARIFANSTYDSNYLGMLTFKMEEEPERFLYQYSEYLDNRVVFLIKRAITLDIAPAIFIRYIDTTTVSIIQELGEHEPREWGTKKLGRIVDTPKVSCTECGSDIPEYSARYVDGNPYCQDCKSDMITCDDCGDLTSHAKYFHGEYYCPECYEDSIAECEECGNDFLIDDMTDGYCDDCYSDTHATCKECGSTYLNEDMTEGYCDDCYSDLHDDCEKCGDSTLKDDLIEGRWCASCFEELKEVS